MKNCIECNHKFTISDRLKSIIRLKGYLQCPNCNSKYKTKPTFYGWLYYFLVLIISHKIFTYIELNNSILRYSLYALFVTPILMAYDILPLSWHKYRKLDP